MHALQCIPLHSASHNFFARTGLVETMMMGGQAPRNPPRHSFNQPPPISTPHPAPLPCPITSLSLPLPNPYWIEAWNQITAAYSEFRAIRLSIGIDTRFPQGNDDCGYRLFDRSFPNKKQIMTSSGVCERPRMNIICNHCYFALLRVCWHIHTCNRC